MIGRAGASASPSDVGSASTKLDSIGPLLVHIQATRRRVRHSRRDAVGSHAVRQDREETARKVVTPSMDPSLRTADQKPFFQVTWGYRFSAQAAPPHRIARS
nr:hypothetical protein CFP56_11795 [Quercus suber]